MMKKLLLLLALLPCALFAQNRTVTFEWSHATAATVDSYVIEEQTATTWVPVATVNRPAPTTAVPNPVAPLNTTVANIIPGTHNYRISARNAQGVSPPSPPITLGAQAPTVPATPGNFRIITIIVQ